MNKLMDDFLPTHSLASRREFLAAAGVMCAAGVLPDIAPADDGQPRFELSLVESSLTRSLAKGRLTHLDFPKVAKEEFGIEAIEYVSTFFPENPADEAVLEELNKRAAEFGVRQLLIMIDGSVRIGDADASKQKLAIQSARKWVDVARALGCHSIQINCASSGEPAEQQDRALTGLAELCEYAAGRKINILVGNYGGVTAKAAWVAGLIKALDQASCRTLPRINHLRTDEDYQNFAGLVPLAKGMTADTFQFDEQGNELSSDFVQAMLAIRKAGYRGYIGINYRGTQLDEYAGILDTKALLERIGQRGN